MKKFAIYTLGCKVNQYESEAISDLFLKAGYVLADFDDFSDIYIINTCTVTAMSDRKSRQIIRRAKKYNKNSLVIVTGCYAQTNPEAIKKIEGVNLIIGTSDRNRIVDLVEALAPDTQLCHINDIMKNHEFEKLSLSSYHERTRAYIKIQEGCNQFCSYCIIPYARGPIRSRSEEEVLKETEIMVQNGYTEIIYTGIHVASYGIDRKNTSLSQLLVKANNITGIERIRLSSIEPMTLNNEFIDSIKSCDKLCHHFHLSLQSGCDETLQRMNRKYTTTEYKAIVEGLRQNYPDVAITTDIMTGFPGETDEEFNKTINFVKEINFADAHIFQYSQRDGTPAAKRPDQINPDIKEKRSKELIKICNQSRDNFIKSFLGKTLTVLFEQRVNEIYFEGKTSNYITVYVKTDKDLQGQYFDVLLTDYSKGIAYGKLINN